MPSTATTGRGKTSAPTLAPLSPPPWAARKPWVVLAACLALLALLGTSPDADILAHLFGLLVGGVLGLAAGLALPRAPRPSVQWMLALAGLGALVASWLCASS